MHMTRVLTKIHVQKQQERRLSQTDCASCSCSRFGSLVLPLYKYTKFPLHSFKRMSLSMWISVEELSDVVVFKSVLAKNVYRETRRAYTVQNMMKRMRHSWKLSVMRVKTTHCTGTCK